MLQLLRSVVVPAYILMLAASVNTAIVSVDALLQSGRFTTFRQSSAARFIPSSVDILPRTSSQNRSPSLVLVRAAQAKDTDLLDDDDDDEDYDSMWSSTTLVPETSFGSEIVPEGQRPINEYLNILRQPLFDWAINDTKLLTRCGIVYAIFMIFICYPIAGATFTQSNMMWPKVTSSNVGAISVVLALLLRLYSGWLYVGNRLKSPIIEYEETGWYDGDVERKTVSEQKRDKFLYQSNVVPVIQRLQTLLAAVTTLFVASIIAFNVATTNQPLFDQYNPDVLEQLKYDEKLAEQAATQAGNRPTYCDNRYYRAVAGAAPGCQ